MDDRVIPLFESILDQRKTAKQAFIENEKKQLVKRLEDLEERSKIVKALIQELVGTEHTQSSEGESNKVLELLALENQLLQQSIDRAKKQKTKALQQVQEAERRAQELKLSEKPLKQRYKDRIAELQQINRQKEQQIQEIDQVNSALYNEIKEGCAKSGARKHSLLQLMQRKKQSVIEIIREVQDETEECKAEIAELTDVYKKLQQNWTHLNSLLATPKQLNVRLDPVLETAEATRDEYWQRTEPVDLDLPEEPAEPEEVTDKYEI